MDQSFNSPDFIAYVGNELVRNFGHAGSATTPSLVSGARETEIRRKLESLLPPAFGVGTGCVIDSYGNTSAQQDVVLFERHICPVFSINDTPESTYYPCEGVLAVGEIKSYLDSKELKDSFGKIRSVKSLQRHMNSGHDMSGNASVPFRNYGNISGLQGTPDESLNQRTNHTDQVFGFVLAGELKLKPQTLCDKIAEHCGSSNVHETPNLFVTLDAGVAGYVGPSNKMLRSQHDSSSICFCTPPETFSYLLHVIYGIARNNRTACTECFGRYVSTGNSVQLTPVAATKL